MRASTSLAHLSRWASVLMLLLFVATFTYAQITPSADAYTRSTSSKANYGADTVLHVNGATDTTFIQFNLASIPSGAVVSQATLKLFVDSVTTPGSFNVNYVTGPWSEGTVTYELAPAIGATIASNVAITVEDKNQYILVNVTSAVQAWLDGSEPNHGIALVANGAFQAGFDSKENALTAHPPQLDTVFAAGSSLQLGDNNLICVGSPLAASGASLLGETPSGNSPLNIPIHCTPGGGGGGGSGTVTSVGFTAPSTDFIVTGSPVTTSGTLGLGWITAPDYNNTANAIVKRDSSGNFSAGTINAATGFNLGGNSFAFGSYANTNAFLGFAGNTTMTGVGNTASGYQALSANTTGRGNTAYGLLALLSNTTGNGNIAVGGHALLYNTTGTVNTATGGYALNSATTASYNTADGNSALYATTTGSNNTASGYQAMYYNTTGSYNTALGYEAAYDQTYTGLNNATAIGAYSDVTQNNSLVLGCTPAMNSNCPGTVNVGIGTTAPQYALDVHGTANFTGLVNFASSQTFPGLATLGGANTFTGVETFDNQVNVAVPSSAGYGLNVSSSTTSIWANATGSNSTGISASGGSTGVAGQASNGVGVSGSGLGANSEGVYGSGQYGVYGYGNNANVSPNVTYGVYGYGYGGSLATYGVYGYAPSGASPTEQYTGVFGYGATYGVYGSSSGNIGVSGYGPYFGVYGSSTDSSCTNCAGVIGYGFNGVEGSGSDTGVAGAAPGRGVNGSATGTGGTGVEGQAFGSGSMAVYGNSYSGGSYGVYSNGNFAVSAGSTKSAIAVLPDDRAVLLYSVESPENWYEDFGSGKLQAGVATVNLDAIFAQTVNTSLEYHVFLTPKGDCKGLYVTNETAAGFEVRELSGGQSSVAFDYRIVAKRKGLENLRLEVVSTDHEQAARMRKQVAERPLHTPILKEPSTREQASIHGPAELPEQAAHPAPPLVPAKLAPPKVLPPPPGPQTPAKPPVPPQHTAVPEVQK